MMKVLSVTEYAESLSDRNVHLYCNVYFNYHTCFTKCSFDMFNKFHPLS